jgi:pimeloyl-ACP methyl ester carboxylesterase
MKVYPSGNNHFKCLLVFS